VWCRCSISLYCCKIYNCRGGLSLQTLSSEERLRRAPLRTVLGTHHISRSFPLPPQSMPASPAAASAALRPRDTRTPSRVQAAVQSNTTCARSTLCGRPRSRASACIACGSRGYSGSALLSDGVPPAAGGKRRFAWENLLLALDPRSSAWATNSQKSSI